MVVCTARAVQCSEPGLCSIVVAMSCFCMCYAIISGSSEQFNYTHCTWSDNSHHSEEAVAIQQYVQ